LGKKRPHVIVMALIQEWLTSVFGARYVTPEAPIDVAPEDIPTNEPEPDLAVTTRPCEEYPRNPQPRDIRLLVEISDTTLAFDLRKKARLYARAGISEYWVVDIAGRRVFVHREPQGDKYETVTAYGETESVAPLAAPDRFLPVGDAFPGSALP
jgi:Uma2 family endonuclease